VGLIGITLPAQVGGAGGEGHGGFIELVPWNAELEWDVSPWGKWCGGLPLAARGALPLAGGGCIAVQWLAAAPSGAFAQA
jgi:hypothetical protein